MWSTKREAFFGTLKGWSEFPQNFQFLKTMKILRVWYGFLLKIVKNPSGFLTIPGQIRQICFFDHFQIFKPKNGHFWAKLNTWKAESLNLERPRSSALEGLGFGYAVFRFSWNLSGIWSDLVQKSSLKRTFGPGISSWDTQSGAPGILGIFGNWKNDNFPRMRVPENSDFSFFFFFQIYGGKPLFPGFRNFRMGLPRRFLKIFIFKVFFHFLSVSTSSGSEDPGFVRGRLPFGCFCRTDKKWNFTFCRILVDFKIDRFSAEISQFQIAKFLRIYRGEADSSLETCCLTTF